MPKAKLLPSGNYRVLASVTINGKREFRSFTAEKSWQAEAEANEWIEYYRTVAKDTSTLTVGDAINEYISLKDGVLSVSTIAGYLKLQRNYFEEIKHIQLRRLTQIIVQKWVSNLAKRLSAKTVGHAYGLLTAVINVYAPRLEIGDITLPQKKKSNPSALTRKEIATLINGIQGDEMEVPILLAVWLGLRRSEILALKWDDIDFEKMQICIDEAIVLDKDYNIVLKETKNTSSERWLSLPIYIAEKIKNLPQKGERIFEGIPVNKWSNRFPKLCEKIGIPRYRFHDLRHTMATIGVTLNIADKVVMARGGWSNYATMKNIYQAVLQDDTVAADALYNAYFTESLKKS
jgi:integrase